MLRPITRKRETGEAGNPGQFGSTSRGESAADFDLSTMSDAQLAEALGAMDLGDSLAIDFDGDGQADGELDIMRDEQGSIYLEGTITRDGADEQVRLDIPPVSSLAELKGAIEGAVQGLSGSTTRP